MSGLCSLARPKKNDANKKEATGLHRILLFPFTDRFTGFHHVLSGFKMGYWVYRGFMVFLEKKVARVFFTGFHDEGYRLVASFIGSSFTQSLLDSIET